ncbi:MAG: AbrB/MazE/SpoVT family DNA-binding domain-containing protein [Sulfurimonas sp.]|nr:AbrB/MazE/SpoVT family DNA-binding domain-containing protein [Sulfurimonas sp.]MDQ7068478.1 AbrB/MazE/SpoVT family DNA-binding domain-containing protein [Sulfurimonas sp.]
MTATISKWGNSQGLRFPKDIMKDLHLAIGDKVNIFIKDNQAIIEPIKKEKIKYNIEELVSQIPADYKPREEFVNAVGKEEW